MIPDPLPDPQATHETAPRRLDLSPGAFLIVLLILAVVIIAALAALLLYSNSDNRKLRDLVAQQEAARLRSQVEAKKAEEHDKLVAAANRQNEVAASAQTAAGILENLLGQLNRLTTEASTLKTNDTGRTVALHADLVPQARRLYETILPALTPIPEVSARLEGVRRIDRQVRDALGTQYQPSPEHVVTLQNAAVWGEQELRKVNDAQNLLLALVRESEIKVNQPKVESGSPTLAVALAQLAQAEAAWQQRLISEQTGPTRTNAMLALADAEKDLIERKKRLEANAILAPVKQAEQQEANRAKIQDATNTLQAANAEVQAQTLLDEARRIELRKKASDPQVKLKLAPFITPGHWGMKRVQYELKPHSLSELQGVGALNETMAGLHKLVDIASNAKDKIRPRWKMPAYWPRNPTAMEKAKEAQQLLIELGPVLVEMKMLEP